MDLADFAESCFVLDLETFVSALITNRTNASVAKVQAIIARGCKTITRVRKEMNDFQEGSWSSNDLDGISTHSIDKKLQLVAAEMIEVCIDNGLDVSASSIRNKILLIAVSKIEKAAIITVDIRPTEISMSSLCRIFGVTCVDFAQITGY
ncbi:hypothetical protein [Pelagibacterium sp. H642]|uniref:hypothetical protein n=1 Tax=Pelagibacterium sp. H642 TaxID=1881069 RepID=UPI00281590A2|nr:hypothetical protein [Pelagibacterium sp. H642]WMT89719.1 hypothetical protein NO934_13065 [Pelagibacterium sp. H642]